MLEHAEDCTAVGNEDCEPERGVWIQPPGEFVNLAIEELGEDAPWCQIHHRAFEHVDEAEATAAASIRVEESRRTLAD